MNGTFNSLSGISVGTVLHLLFPKSEWSYDSQIGTLEDVSANFDYAIADVQVISLDTDLKEITTTSASFTNQQSLFRFNFTDGTNNINVKEVTINTANNLLVKSVNFTNGTKNYDGITISPATASNQLYVSLRNESTENDTYTFFALDQNSNAYTATKGGNLKFGKYYTSTITLSPGPIGIEVKASTSTPGWTQYEATNVNGISGFTPSAAPPTLTNYGALQGKRLGTIANGFKTKKDGNRWWLLDPRGYAFISKGVAEFSIGESPRQQANKISKFGGIDNWIDTETAYLKNHGFNSLGAWSTVKKSSNGIITFPFTIIYSPMAEYIKYLKDNGLESAAFAGAKSWEGYPYDFAMVFDTKFDEFVESAVANAGDFKSNTYLIGYFLDNEVPWKNYALENCLTKWPSTHINHIKAQEWLDARKGMSGCTIDDATEDDKKAFIAYCYGVYLEKVTTALKNKDNRHLILGSRFNQWDHELSNQYMFEKAGEYCDVISINHYRRWQPDQSVMNNWAAWSGKPFIITEFYTKGADSGLSNVEGAGWIVKNQIARGLFYQNFVIELIKNGNCVGWHWYKYIDDDPEVMPDASNKGIGEWDCTHYEELLIQMKKVNDNTYNLIDFYDTH